MRPPEIPLFCLYLHRQKKRQSRKKIFQEEPVMSSYVQGCTLFIMCKKPMHFIITRTCLEMGIREHHHLWLYELTDGLPCFLIAATAV